MKINAFIACRLGSTRVKFKNLLLLNGKPLFTFLTDSAINCKKISDLYINTDSNIIIDIAKDIYKNKINYFKRDSHLGTSKTSLDDYAYDFMKKIPGDITIFLNPCSIFLKSETIDNAIDYFINNNLDSCCASQLAKTHCFFKNESINFDTSKKQPRSQDIEPIHCMTSGFFIWKSSVFMSHYENNLAANFCGKFESYGISNFESIDIDTHEDLDIAEKFLIDSKRKSNFIYHPLVSKLIKKDIIKPN